MKATIVLSRAMAATMALVTALGVCPRIARSQIFVTSYHGTGSGMIHDTVGLVGKYNLDGTAIDPSLISYGLSSPIGIAVSGSNLFVADYGFGFGAYVQEYTTAGAPVNPSLIGGAFQTGVAISGSSLYVSQAATVAKYTTAGSAVNSLLITGLNGPFGVAVSPDGARLFVANSGDGKIGEYDTATGAAINAALIAGLNTPTGLAISGSHLFIADSGDGTIGEYNLDGTVVNATLVTGLSDPVALAVLGNSLYVVNNGTDSVGEYYATTGAVINAALITGLDNPQGIAVVPEPASWLLLAFAAAGLFAIGGRDCRLLSK